MAIVERLIPLDHPAAQGHFPGNPILPAAVLVSEVIDAIEHALGPAQLPLRIKSAKFPAPTRPGSRVVIHFQRTETGTIRLSCSVDAVIVLSGEASWEGEPKP